MNKDEQQSTILLNEAGDWQKTAVQGLVSPPQEPESPSRPSRGGYYLVGLIAIAVLLVWIFRHKVHF
jgi:hypothetical protein